VVGVFTPRNLSTAAQALDRAARGHLGKASAAAMNGKLGSHLLLTQVPRIAAQRVLMIGLGRSRDFNDKAYRDACRASVRALNDYGINDAASFLPELPVGKRPLEWRLMHALQAAADTTYRFDQLKSKKTSGTHPLRKLTFGLQDPGGLAQAQLALKRAHALVEGVALAKDLGNLAPNICTPSHLAQQAEALAKRYTMRCEVLERKDMEKLGMGAMLAVAQGSVEPPKMIILHYQGGQPGDAPIALVGKGITFDTGGISLKPAAEMDEMKFDMCGAASVLGTLKAVAQMRLGINVIGIVPATENMPGGRATRPGDVVKTLSGQSVEILNTDAEGRLILCDALSYAQRYKPSAVVDIATLTGACVIALGHVAAGLFANDDALATELTAAGDYAHDRVWRMPLWDDYQEQLRSNFADMANIGGRPAGSVTAACFLSRFAKPLRWAHLDIAGVAWRSGKEKGATGRPVPLLTRFLIERAGTAR
jgi:leucyl aminopeptidase